jgi:hypothetical protein
MKLIASQLLEPDYPDLIKIFRSVEPDPSCRPTAAQALKSVHEHHDGFTRARLKGPVLMHDLSPITVSQMVKRTNEANARQAVRLGSGTCESIGGILVIDYLI